MASLTGLINYYRFEEGGLTRNLATNTDDLILTGSSSVVSQTSATSKTGSRSLSNTGTDNSNYYATTTNISATTACTISVWFKPNSTSTSGRILRIENIKQSFMTYSIACVGVSFFVSSDGVFGISCDIGSSIDTYSTGNGSGNRISFATQSPSNYGFSSSNWNHVAITYTAGTGRSTIISAYLNGTMIQNSVSISQYMWGSTYSIGPYGSHTQCSPGKLYLFGKATGDSGYNPMAGYIDEVMVFNRALSSAEVMNLYNLNYAVSGQTSLLQTSIGSSLIVGNGFVVSGDLSTNGTITTNNRSINAGLGTITAGNLNLISSDAPTTASGFVPTVGATGGITCGAITASNQLITCGSINTTKDGITATGQGIACGGITSTGSINAVGQLINCGAINSTGPITATGQTITCGTLNGSLDASKISGTIAASQIGSIPSTQITGLSSVTSISASSITPAALNIGQNVLTCQQIKILNGQGNDGGSKIYEPDGQLTIFSDDYVDVMTNNSLSGGKFRIFSVNKSTSGQLQCGRIDSDDQIVVPTIWTTNVHCGEGIDCKGLYCGTGYGDGGYGGFYYSIRAANWVASKGGFQTVSDKRTKTNIKSINLQEALKNIRLIDPVNYNLIQNPEPLRSGYIAQNIKDCLPNCVNVSSDYIPNINDKAIISNKNVVVLLNSSTKCIDISNNISKIRFFAKSNPTERKSMTLKEIINDTTFTINEEFEDDDIYIYGQKVDDFHSLSYDDIHTVSLAALKQVDIELQETKQIVAQQQTQIDTLTQELSDLKKLIQSLLPSS